MKKPHRKEKKECSRKVEKQKSSPQNSHIKNLAQRFAKLIALIVTFGMPGDNPAPTPIPLPTPPKLEKTEGHTYEIDGIKITSKTVPRAIFEKAFRSAQSKIGGGPFWNATQLNVEFGDLSKDVFSETYHDIMGLSGTDATTFDRITTRLDELEHELIHFLLGPHGNQIPRVFAEFIASIGDPPEKNEYDFDDLDQPWIQMASPDSLTLNPSLTGARQGALHHVARRHKDKIPILVQEIIKGGEISFEQMQQMLKAHGIDHNIFHLGKNGQVVAFITFYDRPKMQRTYQFIRFRRKDGQEDLWNGQISVEAQLTNGKTDITLQMDKGIVTFPYLPQGITPTNFHIKTEDGLDINSPP